MKQAQRLVPCQRNRRYISHVVTRKLYPEEHPQRRWAPHWHCLAGVHVPGFATLAQAQSLKVNRFTGIFLPHGAAPGYWEPKSTDAGFEYPFIWKPLEHLREKVVLTTGMWSQSAENPPGVTGADHFVASAFLAGVKPKKTTGADVEVATTLDQILAQNIGQSNLLPSLQLAVEDPGSNSTNCGEGYSCIYTNTISWASPSRPMPMEINPQVVFERMFGSGGTAEERTLRRTQQSSILDSVTRIWPSSKSSCSSDRIRWISISKTCGR